MTRIQVWFPTLQLISLMRWSILSFFILQSSIFISCSSRPAPPAPYRAFVVCQDSGTVAVVDMAELRVIASLKVSPQPEAAVWRPQSKEIYVAGRGGLDRIDAANLKVYLNSRTDQYPRSLTFSRDGRFAYYLMEPEPAPAGSAAQPPQAGLSHIAIFNCESGREDSQLALHGSLSHLVLTADGKTLLATDPIAGLMYCVDIAARKPLGTIRIGKGAGSIAVQPYGAKAFVSNTAEKTVSVVDTQSRQLFSHIELGSAPGSLLLKPDGGELFVLSPGASTLTILDAFHDNVMEMLTAGKNPVAGVFRRDSSVLYVANAGDGSIMALDVANRRQLGTTLVGSEPRALALTPDERFLAVADTGTSSLAVLIAEPGRMASSRSMLVTSLPVGGRPIDVVVPSLAAQ